MAMHFGLQQQRYFKVSLFVLALLPFVRLIWALFTQHLGANPIEFITRNTGDWTLYFLCITLSVTPLRRLLQLPFLVKSRRMLGLYTFFYACLHFLTFFWFDHFFDVPEMLKDVLKRPFILVGFMAFLLLVPLAMTSTNKMIKRLGAKRWQLLHRFIYLIVLLGLLHYFWMKAGKQDFTQPIIMSAIVGLLFTVRVIWYLKQRRQERLNAVRAY